MTKLLEEVAIGNFLMVWIQYSYLIIVITERTRLGIGRQNRTVTTWTEPSIDCSERRTWSRIDDIYWNGQFVVSNVDYLLSVLTSDRLNPLKALIYLIRATLKINIIFSKSAIVISQTQVPKRVDDWFLIFSMASNVALIKEIEENNKINCCHINNCFDLWHVFCLMYRSKNLSLKWLTQAKGFVLFLFFFFFVSLFESQYKERKISECLKLLH